MNIGIIGAGQLSQMLAQAGTPLGMEFTFFSPEKESCAAPFGTLICAGFSDDEALKSLIEQTDFITYEFENIPRSTIEFLEQKTTVHPSAKALAISHDRVVEKTKLNQCDIPTTMFSAVGSWDDLCAALKTVGVPSILKTRTMGYDGKGQFVIREQEDAEKAWETLGSVPCILEKMVPFDREVSVIAVRDEQGNKKFYPLVENVHKEGILRLAKSCAADPKQKNAEELIGTFIDRINYVGIMTMELFQCGETLLANEIAPRVHNSGHWTIEGAKTSQFENHLRAVCGMPLGDTTLIAPSAMINLIGFIPSRQEIESIPGAVLHVYGKEDRPNRKVGHITLLDKTNDPAGFNQNLLLLLNLAKGG